MWTNLASPKVIQWAYELIPRPPTCLVDDMLGPRPHSCMVHHDDWPPLVMVNKLGLPWGALPTFLSFPHFHAFRNPLGMIWDFHSSSMEKPDADERNIPCGSTPAPKLCKAFLEKTHKQILGQVMDLNCLTWIFSCLGRIVTFWLITPTHSTPYFICCTFWWVSYGNARGGDVTIRQIHLW